ncbi:MAG: GTP-binding protein [Cellulomonadaceae bacterium]
MNVVDVVAVVGACAPERQHYAQQLVAASARTLIPAARLAQAADPIAEATELAPWADRAVGAVAEFPSAVSVVDLIGALTDPAAAIRLSGVICVVDAAHLLDDLASEDSIVTRRNAAGRPHDATARALLTVTQLEYASMIVMVNWDSLPTAELSTLMALVSTLSPHARLRMRSDDFDVAHSAAAYTSEQVRAGWVGVLNGDADPHMTDPRVSAFRYEQLRPLHPGRLKRLLDERIEPGEFGLVIRSAGFCRFATRTTMTLQWEHVGRTIAFQLASRDDDVSEERDMLAVGQDLAFIGLDLNVAALSAAFDQVALTDAELAAGPQAWARFPDPFPTLVHVEDRAD